MAEEERKSRNQTPFRRRGRGDGNGRNAALFRLVGRAAHHADNIDQLLDYARTQNECCAEPMTDAEVTKIVSNVWKTPGSTWEVWGSVFDRF
jgi:hypothetical protein